MKKKILALTMAVAMVSSLVACGSSSETSEKTEATNEAAEETSTETVQETDNVAIQESAENKGTLVMATNAEFPPYEYHDGSDDQIVGIDAEIAAAIAEKLGYTLEIEDIAFDSVIPEVTSGKADFGMAGMTVTEERKKSVNFSDSYATAVQVVIVTEDSDIAGIDDLSGKIIGVQSGTTGDLYATDDFGDENVERYNKGMEAVQALSQGKVDAVIIDNEPAKVFVQETAGLKILESAYAEEEYAIAINLDNTEFLNDVNAALAELKADGTIDNIVSKYITTN
ncbi:MAG: transporter substrate-binding domain-containing protein [Butyrivibrio sp.]|nr:transporter substrate-binding domain-containing protein [Butyrivibrio sp.]